jgi:hypothetical protein
LVTIILFCRAGGILNNSIAVEMASFSVGAVTVPGCSVRLRMMSTRQRATMLCFLR